MKLKLPKEITPPTAYFWCKKYLLAYSLFTVPLILFHDYNNDLSHTVCWCLRSLEIWADFSSILATSLSRSPCRSSLCSRVWVASIRRSSSWCSLIKKLKWLKYWTFFKKKKKKKNPYKTRDTHKLICPSSSCRAKSRSDSELSDWSAGGLSGFWEAVIDEEKSLRRLFLAPHPDLCRAAACSHSLGWWCFIMWSMLCTLAWTEWLGLVDYDR